MQKCEKRKVMFGVGKQIQVVAKVPFFTGRIPTDIAVRL